MTAGIDLSKRNAFNDGQAIDLIDTTGAHLTDVYIGGGWITRSKPAVKVGNFRFGKKKAKKDYNVIGLVIGRRGGVVATSSGDDENRSFYSGVIEHSPDDTTGAIGNDDYDNEWLRVHLNRLSADIQGFVVFFDSADDSAFADVSRAHCRVIDESGQRKDEIGVMRAQISDPNSNTMALVAFVRNTDGSWRMKIIEESFFSQGETQLLTAAIKYMDQTRQG